MVKPDIQKMQNIDSEKNLEIEFVDLKEAAKLFGYTQHHFGLLCRQGKLQSKRIGKKWMTKKEWIEKYLNSVEENYKKTNIHYTKAETVEVEKVPHFAFLASGSLKNAMSVSFIAVLLWSFAFLGLQAVERYSDISRTVVGVIAKISSINTNQNVRVFIENTTNNYVEFSNHVVGVTNAVVSIKDNVSRAYMEADNKVVHYVNEMKKKITFTVPDVIAFSLSLRAKSINTSKEIYSDLTKAHMVTVSKFNHYISYASFMSDFDLNRSINNVVNSYSSSLFTFIDSCLANIEKAGSMVQEKTADILHDVRSDAKRQYIISRIAQISNDIDVVMASLPKAVADVFSISENEVLPEKSEKVSSFTYLINGDEIKSIPRKIGLQLAYFPRAPELTFKVNVPTHYMLGGGFIELEPMNFIEHTRENIVAFKDDLKVWSHRSKNMFVRLAYTTADHVKDYSKKVKKIRLAFFATDETESLNYDDEKEKDIFVGDEVVLPETKEGVVVLPKELVGGDLGKMEREIKDIFSDEVFVKPDEEGDAGIIQPIFKKGKGEEYLYVMVPVEKNLPDGGN